MKEYEQIKVEETKEIPKSMTCNKCGKHIEFSGEKYQREFQSNIFQTIYTSFGYGSKLDMDSWEFDLCEECLVEFVRTFKHLPEGYDEKYINNIFER